MWGVDEIKSYLKDNLKPSRYGHTLGVVKTAIELAEIYNEDKQKAEIAALCHDIAKNMSYEDMLKVIEEENLKLSNDEKGDIICAGSSVSGILPTRRRERSCIIGRPGDYHSYYYACHRSQLRESGPDWSEYH